MPGTERQIPFNRAAAASPSQPNPPAPRANENPPASDWAGRYSGQNLTLELAGANGRYQGSIALGNARYVVNAQAQGDRLNGSFQANGQTFLFEVRRQDNGFNLLLNGQSFALQR